MVTKKPKGLGLGLEALLGPKVAEPAPPDPAAPHALTLDRLHAGKYQPRTRMDEGSLYELAESIKSQGVMQPILVRPLGNGQYEIIAGERRFRAARLAGLTEVPVLVGVGISTPEQAVETCQVADGVIVGSAVVRRAIEVGTAEAIGSLVAEFRGALDRSW